MAHYDNEHNGRDYDKLDYDKGGSEGEKERGESPNPIFRFTQNERRMRGPNLGI
jgi:hypothetical protein